MNHDVLNPALYNRLRKRVGRVRVSNAGEACIMHMGRNTLSDAPRLVFEHTGEYYQVNCPFCSDTRRRLYVHHMYGQRDSAGRRLSFLAICYNEGCLQERDNEQALWELMQDDLFDTAIIKEGKTVDEANYEVVLPGPCVPLTRLAPDHDARHYVTGRGFSVQRLSDFYGVCYCTSSHFNLARGRLIIPVYAGGKLKGWQARYVGELPWKDPEKKRTLPPKYFTCPGSKIRSRAIYNFERMKQWATGVIVEGPSDVWSFGPMAGCIFGNTMTELQRRLFLLSFGHGRTGVLLLDPEEFESKATHELVAYMQQRMPELFCAVKLPKGCDPGSLDRELLRDYVQRAAAQQGVKVVYERRM